jgi:hypothetical protein
MVENTTNSPLPRALMTEGSPPLRADTVEHDTSRMGAAPPRVNDPQAGRDSRLMGKVWTQNGTCQSGTRAENQTSCHPCTAAGEAGMRGLRDG